MRDHSKHVELNRDEAIGLLLGVCAFQPGAETVAVADAYGRVLAEDAAAQWDMPTKRTCRLDSVAVRWTDFENGMPDTSEWTRGVEWQFGNTGVAMPDGFDTAIVIEHCEVSEDNDRVRFLAAPSAQFAGTSAVGSKMHAGDVLVSAGAVVTADVLATLGQCGMTEVSVVKKPVVAFIPTGGELVKPGGDPSDGKNFETNSALVSTKITEWGGEPRVWDILPDDPAIISEAIVQACAECDIVIINAGSSKGSEDWNVEMMDERARVLYHQTNHGPGHHSSAAVLDGTPVIGISGPPRGAGFTTDFYVWPVIQKYFGLPCELKRVKATTVGSFGKSKKHAVQAQAAGAKLAGEQRPMEAQDGSAFFSVKPVHLTVSEDGALQAELTAYCTAAVDGYYMMPAGLNDDPPAEGTLISVDLRPKPLGA